MSRKHRCVTPTESWLRRERIIPSILGRLDRTWKGNGWSNPPEIIEQRYDRNLGSMVGLRIYANRNTNGFVDIQRNALWRIMLDYCYELTPGGHHIRLPIYLDFFYEEPQIADNKERPFKRDYSRKGWMSDWYGETDAEKRERRKRSGGKRGRPRKDKDDEN